MFQIFFCLTQVGGLSLTLRAGLRWGLTGLQPQAHAEIGPPLYQVNEVIKVTDTITFNNSEGVI